MIETMPVLFAVNVERLLDTTEMLINTPSVVGYTREIHPVLEKYAQEYGYTVEYDQRRTAYIHVGGKDTSRTVCVGAHLDTIGLVVRTIHENGWLEVRNLGGINFHSIEGENVLIHTRHNGNYTGSVICKSHSSHVFDDARSLERDFANMAILIDEDVRNREDVEALGIHPGDLISIEPRFVRTDAGYIKSRHIDDKANAAILLEALAILAQYNLEPAFDTWFAFPICEEIGLGGRFVPEKVDEYLALDIGLIGPLQNGDEKKVTIAAADRISPYDWELTTLLADLAKENGIQYAMDVYYRYSSDATAALVGGNNLAPLSIGMGTMCTHGYERTHVEGILETLKLTLAYLLMR